MHGMGVRRPPVEGWTNYRIQRARSWRMDMLSLGESFVPDAYVVQAIYTIQKACENGGEHDDEHQERT